MLLSQTTLSSFMHPIDAFSVLIACMFHDIGHPGRTNDFLINTQHDLAITYNDRSVLENFHAAEAFRTLKNPSFDVTAGCSELERKQLRVNVLRGILATDMSSHFVTVQRINDRVRAVQSSPGERRANKFRRGSSAGAGRWRWP